MTRVLLIENDESNADMLTRRLVRGGYTVRQAPSGRVAVAQARREQPDVILMELTRAELDNVRRTWPLKADPDTVTIPIIALTAHAMLSDREKALAIGCHELETKPVNLERLLRKMETLLETTGNPGQTSSLRTSEAVA